MCAPVLGLNIVFIMPSDNIAIILAFQISYDGESTAAEMSYIKY